MVNRILAAVIISLALVPGSHAFAAKPYNGAEYRTKASFLYGRFETRMKSIGCEGTLASFFTYNDNYPNTAWNEIDIEILGRYTDDVQFNPITPGQVNHVSHQYVPFDPCLDFHVYGFEWTPTYVAWLIDGVEVYRQTGPHIATLSIPQKLMMNVWIPAASTWAGAWNDAVLPAFATYDWISYSSYTPGSGTMGSGNNFTPQWTDSLDAWDQTRWDCASHTWDGNNCDFTPANVVFRDGKMILCLTKSTAPGYTDAVPPSPLWARAERDSIRLMFSEVVDRASAETASNYLMSAGAITGARLLPDQKTVLLTAPGIDALTVTGVIVRNVRDLWSPPNVMPPAITPLIRSPRVSFPLKINIGGNDTLGYRGDHDWSPSAEYGKLDGWTSSYPGATISGTSDPEIYRSDASGMCEYKVRVPNGRYLVMLMFAENYFTGPGMRSMKIWVEGKQVEDNLDLVYRVGYRAAYIRANAIDVADGILDIHLQGLVDNVLLNGLTLTQVPNSIEDKPMGALRPEFPRVLPNYPNPFNGGTTLSFDLPSRDTIRLEVFDTLGRTVDNVVLGEYPAGTSQVIWEPRNGQGHTLPSGVYYCVVSGIHGSAAQKVMYVK